MALKWSENKHNMQVALKAADFIKKDDNISALLANVSKKI